MGRGKNGFTHECHKTGGRTLSRKVCCFVTFHGLANFLLFDVYMGASIFNLHFIQEYVGF